MKRVQWLFLVGFLCATICSADVELPKIINSKMVLQRGVAAPVWGWADPGEQVTVQFAGQTKKAMPDANGKWMVQLDPLTASSEPRVMMISGKNEIKIDDVLVGEVWLASGQSNMEWTFCNIAEEEKAFVLTQKDNNLVRFGIKDIPVHLAQIAPFDYSRGEGPVTSTLCDNNWTAQYKGADEIPGMGIIPTHDTNINTADIHPRHKRTVGERLAAKALKNQYGKDVVATGPRFDSATLSGSQVIVSFKDVDQGRALIVRVDSVEGPGKSNRVMADAVAIRRISDMKVTIP